MCPPVFIDTNALVWQRLYTAAMMIVAVCGDG
jgi:hypothetical protein